MRRRLTVIAALALVTLALSGCMRQSAYYYIQTDDTVDGMIYVALASANTTESDPYKGTGAGDIAATFANSTITPFDNGDWIGYHIEFTDEPLASFADTVEDTWDVQITKSGGKYTVYGYKPTPDDDTMRQAITDGDGFMQLTVSFPGSLVSSFSAHETSAVDEAPGWANWDQLETTNEPSAVGNVGLYFFFVPGWEDLFDPGGLPEPGSPVITPAPGPVVTVVITPDAPVVAPTTASASTPTPTPTPVIAAPGTDDEKSSIPVWVWGAGGALVLALAGLIGYTAANRKPKVPVPTPEPTPEAPKSEAPTK